MIDLGLVNGDNASNAFGINSQGQVVGQSWFWDGHEVTASHAFLWNNGGPMLDLNTLVCNSTDLQLIEADLINDSGWIVSYALRPNGDLRAAILIPNCDQGSSSEANVTGSAANAVVSSRSFTPLTPRMMAVLQTRIERSFRRGLPPRSWPMARTGEHP
jgi:probable HAF family extracellular repeat protein